MPDPAVQLELEGLGEFPGQVKLTGQTRFPERLSSCGGQETVAVTLAARNIRIDGTRVPHQRGLCGPEAGYGAGSDPGFVSWADDRQTVPVLV
ncbi:MAG: hypothetical protein WBP85_10645 [Terracidiphilus sp.]